MIYPSNSFSMRFRKVRKATALRNCVSDLPKLYLATNSNYVAVVWDFGFLNREDITREDCKGDGDGERGGDNEVERIFWKMATAMELENLEAIALASSSSSRSNSDREPI